MAGEIGIIAFIEGDRLTHPDYASLADPLSSPSAERGQLHFLFTLFLRAAKRSKDHPLVNGNSLNNNYLQ
jgi:hypothetical protein